MYREQINQYSSALEREMHVMAYGREGTPLLCFPTQNSMCRNYEDFGMIDELSDFINDGRAQLFVVDTVDAESWSLDHGDNSWRSARQEQYFHYIVDEAVQLIHDRSGRIPAVTGLSMGANHAVITFLRRPDLFRGVIALSGVYNSGYFFHGWMDGTLYDNSPECFLPNMPPDHPYIKLYNQRKIILCLRSGRLGGGKRHHPAQSGTGIPRKGHPCLVRFLGL